jgi:tRNA threonylcarbamoyladenosine biosynthesis protein TsaB
MPNLLLIETATDTCAIAVGNETGLLASRSSADFRDHGRLITRFIEACLQEAELEPADIDAVAVSSGPGSFTSLRIGLATAKGWCYATGRPLIAISTLAAIAHGARASAGAPDQTYYVPLLNARSMGVYLAIYGPDLTEIEPPRREKLQPASLADYRQGARRLLICGDAALKYREELGDDRIDYRPEITAGAGHLLPLARQAWSDRSFVDPAYFEPAYIAPPNITTPKQKRPPLAGTNKKKSHQP